MTHCVIGKFQWSATADNDHTSRAKTRFGMADVVNLRAARKRGQRQQAEREAATNRLAHGRPKSERKLETVRREKASRDLDFHRIEMGEADEIAGR